MKEVSLVLGGGGARGLVHIGAIRAIKSLGYKIISISGTSIGAVVGGIYSAGRLKEYEAWVKSLSYIDVLKFIVPIFSSKGLIKGEKIISYIHNIVGDVAIENLDINFTAVATDLKSEKEFWFNKGDLITAIRASLAIPNIFTPVELEDKLFVDGGVVNPVPVTPTLQDDSDLTIAVSLNGKKCFNPLETKRKNKTFLERAIDYFDEDGDEESLINYFDISEASIDIMQESVSRFKLAVTPPDLLIEIPKDICGLFDYHKAEQLIEYGRNQTLKALHNE